MKFFYQTLTALFMLLASLSIAQPVNDDCANAISVLVGNACTLANYSSIGATEEPTLIAPNPTCGAYQGGDVWFKFVVPTSGNFRIELSNLTSGTAYWSLYSGSCGSFSPLSCTSTNTNFTEPSWGNLTLYLRVHRFNSDQGNDFALCVWEITPPANDFCANATMLDVLQECTPQNFSNQYCTAEPTSIAPNPTCGAYQGGDAWFKFVVPTSGNFRIESTNLTSGTAYWSLYSGSCGSFSPLSCTSTNTNFTEPSWANQTLYLRLYRFNSQQGNDFTLCIWETTPPANDFCANAIMLDVPLECTPQAFSNQYCTAEPTSIAVNPSCGAYQGGDAWFKFVVPISGNFRIESTNLTSGTAYWSLYSGTCGSFTQLSCSSTNTNFNEPTWASQTIYLRVHRFNSQQGNDFTLCVWETVTPPTNDLCSNAIDLSVGVSCIMQPYSSQLSTAEAVGVAANPSCGAFQGGDVWFTFEVPASGNFRIEVENTSSGTANYTGYQGSCGSFTELFCASSDRNFVRPDLAGQVLFLRLFRFNSLQGNNFTLCIWEIEPPVNDACENAIDLPVNDECLVSAFSSQYSVAEAGVAPNPTCGAYQGGDVWFKFTTPASGNFSIDKTNTSNGSTSYALYTGVCGNFTEVLCSNDSSTPVSNPALGGQLVYLRAYRFNSVQGSDFTLCIRATDVAPNNNCADAISLNVGSSCITEIFDNFNSTAEPGVAADPGCDTFIGSDVWFTFVLPASGQAVVNLTAISGGDFASTIYAGTCGAFSEVDCASNGTQLVVDEPLLASQTLYLRVFRVGSVFGGEFSLCIVSGDCSGVAGGSAYFDECGTCVGGTTGLEPCVEDCEGVFGGTAFIDDCGSCAGGTTGVEPCVACTVNGGTVSTTSPRLNLCLGDGVANQVVLSVTSNVGLGRFGLVRQSDLEVIASNATGVFNMENFPAGNYFAGHVSVNDLSQIQGITNVSQLSGCYDLSNQLAVTSLQLNGGLIQANGSTTLCSGSLSFSVADKAGANFLWVLLNQNGTQVIAQNASGVFNFNSLAAGSYRVVHIAYAQGVNLGAIVPPALPECVAASNQVAVTLQSCAAILQSHPNPVGNTADILFSISDDSQALLEVYDLNGRMIKTLYNALATGGGEYRLQFDATGLPNGIYIYRLTTNRGVYIEKFTVAK